MSEAELLNELRTKFQALPQEKQSEIKRHIDEGYEAYAQQLFLKAIGYEVWEPKGVGIKWNPSHVETA